MRVNDCVGVLTHDLQKKGVLLEHAQFTLDALSNKIARGREKMKTWARRCVLGRDYISRNHLELVNKHFETGDSKLQQNRPDELSFEGKCGACLLTVVGEPVVEAEVEESNEDESNHMENVERKRKLTGFYG
jgi:hypothetical protein